MEITLDIAELTIAAAKKTAHEIGIPMNIAIVDDGANLLCFCRMDKAWLGSMDIAIKKAKTARYFNMETGEIGKLSQPGGALYQVEITNNGLVSFPGGIPLKNNDGEVIAAIGVSGGSVEQDYKVAAAGAKAFANHSNLKMGDEKMAVCPLGHHSPDSKHDFHEKYTPEQLVDAQHKAFGFHGGRAVHAKGIVLEGTFTPDPQASTLTTARHLQKESSDLIVRFSNFTSLLDIPDNLKDANARGLAIKFLGSDGFSTDIVAHSYNGFPVKTTDDFREFLVALAASGPDSPKPTEVEKYLESHPAAKTFALNQKNPASFATLNYFAANTFRFTNAAGISTNIRYQFIPQEGEQLLTDGEMAAKSASYLQDDIKARVALRPVKLNMVAQIAGPDDLIDDPSIAWPDTREKIMLGVLEIKKLSSNSSEQDKALIFIPNNIPAGIETADPMLDFRSKAYPISQKGRQ